MQQIKPKVYQYSKNLFTIDGIKLNPEVINKHFPKYSIDSNVYSIYYEQGGKSNYIKYKDGRTTELTSYEPIFEEQFSQCRVFEFECKEEVKKKKASSLEITYKVYLSDIFFENDINKRIELKKKYELERQSYVLDESKLLSFLDNYKKKELLLSDWTQAADIQNQMTDNQKSEWASYRQALRKLDVVNDPLTEAFIPVKPPNPLK